MSDLFGGASAHDVLAKAVDEHLKRAETLDGGDHLAALMREGRAGTLTRERTDSLLLALMHAVPELRAQFDVLPAHVQRAAHAIAAGAAPAAHDVAALPENPAVTALRTAMRAGAEPFSPVVEADGKPVLCVAGATFRNWGLTVQNVPAYTFVPMTKIGVCNVVKWAAANHKRVRASGYRHTWGDLYSADDQVLVSTLPLDVAVDLPAQEPPINPVDELQGIEIVGTVQEDGVTKALCKIGAGTTNEQFRRWCLNTSGGGNWDWTVPLNVIMVEITWGGSNAPICHGAGRRNRTLSDLVTAIEFVNAKGELQTVTDPQQLTAAAGCFGLLGIVISVTLKLDPMSFAAMRPVKRPVMLTIPPPANFSVPGPLLLDGITQAQLDAAWADFVRRCENDYYAEWFWFPYQPDCWINTWPNDGERAQAVDYPSPGEAMVQWLEEWIAECINNWSVFQALPGIMQGWFLGVTAMSQMPNIGANDPPITAPLIDALHFRRGIQNMRVLDMELEIPIPPRADDPTKPDWTVCQRAWWDALAAVFARWDGPMRVALEMRIMADSGTAMAPQFGNTFGTCAIEVLTNLNVTDDKWLSFMQTVADAWTSYKGPDGKPLNVRPHWAKQWRGLTFGGKPVVEYLPAVAYAAQLPAFAAGLEAAAAAGGCTLADLQRTFSNPLLDQLYAGVFSGT